MLQEFLRYAWLRVQSDARLVYSSLATSCGCGDTGAAEEDPLRDVGGQTEGSGMDETSALLDPGIGFQGPSPYGTQDASSLSQHDLDTLHDIVRRAENNVIHISAGMETFEPIQGPEATHRVAEYKAALMDCQGLSRSLRAVRTIPKGPTRDVLALLGAAGIPEDVKGWSAGISEGARAAVEAVHIADVGPLVVTFDLSMPEDY